MFMAIWMHSNLFDHTWGWVWPPIILLGFLFNPALSLIIRNCPMHIHMNLEVYTKQFVRFTEFLVYCARVQ